MGNVISVSQRNFHLEIRQVEREYHSIGIVKRHPLDGPYKNSSLGMMSFASKDVSSLDYLRDVKAFYVEFDDTTGQRLNWADILRVKVLNSLVDDKRNWYLSFFGDMVDDNEPANNICSIDDDIKRKYIDQLLLPNTTIQSYHLFPVGTPDDEHYISRLFVSVPNVLLEEVLLRYLPNNYPNVPIEGYCMENNQVNKLQVWSTRPKDGYLLRDVFDDVLLAFYTFPAENSSFAFFTKKLDFDEFIDRLRIDDLKQLLPNI